MRGITTKCIACESNLPDDSTYCPACGKKVEDIPFGTILVCAKCGAKNSRTERLCVACDADLDEPRKRRISNAFKGFECQICGVAGPAGSHYCRSCGASLRSSPGWQSFLGPEDSTHQHEIIRERQVIMIRCKYCGSLNGPEVQKCSSCGAQM